MIPSTYRIVLDIHDAHSSVCLDMKKNDTGRKISITLTDGGFPYQISEECYAVFTATKSDGNIVLHECQIHGNTIFYDILPQTTAAVGLAECEIKLYGADDKVITSPGFNILINDTSYTEGDEVQSETEVTALTHLISEAATVITKGQNTIAEGEAVNARSEELIGDLVAQKVSLDQQVADAKSYAGAANKSAMAASLAQTRTAESASWAATSARNAKTSEENAAASVDEAGRHAASAANFADAANQHRIQAAEAQKLAENAENNAQTHANAAVSAYQSAANSSTNASLASRNANGSAAAARTAADEAKAAAEEAKAASGGKNASTYPSVKDYKAKGDGVTDDTAAFQTALAENRVVFVPGGTYVLSYTLVIRENCCLELSQDTVLKFTQTEGNCIEMRGSAVLRGNHGIISTAYGLSGNAISLDTALDGEPHNSIPPYAMADPMFKRQRFIYDVNIVKPNSAGFYRSEDGVCTGTAIHMSAEGTASIPWMWAINISGIRIAGGFSYGIHAVNFDDPNKYTDNAWNHDMRVEAVIEGCEVGAALENCNGAHLNVTVQPNVATDSASTPYAKHGIYLKDSRFVDLLRSRVWDWNANNSLWTEGGEYQHIALIGNCRGLLLDDFLCHETSADIRTLIYTDTPSNFDTMSILQEPGSKWFKSVDNKPYFNDGTSDKQLMLKTEKFSAEQAEFIHPADGYYTYTPKFQNLVSGYQDGQYLLADGNLAALSGYTTTDFIPIDGADEHIYRIGGEGITWNDPYLYCRIAWYDADKNPKGATMPWDKVGSSIYYPQWVEDDCVAAAFSTSANNSGPKDAVYFRITAKGKGENLIVTIDEAQDYTAVWHGEPKKLDDSIHAKNDWNAAEGETGHIENRTHYSEFSNVIFPETLVTWDESTDYAGVLELTAPITEGKTYQVAYNGEVYTLKAQVPVPEMAMVTLGNLSLIGMSDTGEPFLIGYMDGQTMIQTETTVSDNPQAGSAAVRIAEEVVQVLPRKFLPPGSYIIRDIDTSTNPIVVNESYDNFAEFLYNGGTVYVEFASDSSIMRALVTSAIFAAGEIRMEIYNNGTRTVVSATNGTWTPPGM